MVELNDDPNTIVCAKCDFETKTPAPCGSSENGAKTTNQ